MCLFHPLKLTLLCICTAFPLLFSFLPLSNKNYLDLCIYLLFLNLSYTFIHHKGPTMDNFPLESFVLFHSSVCLQICESTHKAFLLFQICNTYSHFVEVFLIYFYHKLTISNPLFLMFLLA